MIISRRMGCGIHAGAVAFVFSNHNETTVPNINPLVLARLSVIRRNCRVVALGFGPENLEDLGISVSPITRVNAVHPAFGPRLVAKRLDGYSFGLNQLTAPGTIL
jgi:hypothetical protein